MTTQPTPATRPTLTTTFAMLKQHGACAYGYRMLAKHLGGIKTYGGETPIPLLTILEHNGLMDTLWAVRAVAPALTATRDLLLRLYAADCAEHVLPIFEARYPADKRVRRCMELTRLYATGQATQEELEQGRRDAAAAYAYAASAAYAFYASSAATYAADAAYAAATYAADAADAANAAAANAAAADAAFYAANDAANAAADADAAAHAAYAAERQWQSERLAQYLRGEL